jgi:hypothetical protein
MIEINGSELNQWDKGRSVKVTVTGATHVHFANQGDSRSVTMELKDEAAKIPDYLLQTGKQLCVYAVAVSAVENRVTLERKVFSVRKRECPEDYVYEDDTRNYIYKLIQDSEDAIKNANDTAEELRKAKDNGDFTGPKGDPGGYYIPSKGTSGGPGTPGGLKSVITFTPSQDGMPPVNDIELPTGERGGYYIPYISTNDGKTYLAYRTSIPGMESVSPVPFPLGPAGPKGENGYTPQRGVDYWTPDDIAEIKSYVEEAILGGAW